MNGTPDTLLVLARPVTNRLRYIVRLMAGRLLGLKCSFTADGDEFERSAGPKLVYGGESRPGALFLHASGLLHDSGTGAVDPSPGRHAGETVLFACSDPAACLPFDPLAAAFFMASRYEEYDHPARDHYGRFPAPESVAFREGFLERPVIHTWTAMLKAKLKERYPQLLTTPPRYRYVPTIDIDHAWQYLGRGALRTLGGMGRSLASGDIAGLFRRLQVMTGLAPDPFDTYAYIRRVHESSAIEPRWFFLFSDRGGADNNVNLSSPRLHTLLRELDASHRMGVHPSLGSSRHPTLLDREVEGLSSVIGRPVTSSRQHFLTLTFPGTCRELIRQGITDDYSLGYASHSGFRAGLAVPFPFYDLTEERETGLTLHPLSVMDVTLRDYLRLTAEQSRDRIEEMVYLHRSVGGEFVSLWHNESLAETGRWKGWRRVYETMVRRASEGSNR